MKKLVLGLSLLGCTMIAGHGVNAATQSVTANIAFDTALTMTKNGDVEFGTVEALNDAVYRVTTAGVLSVVSGGGLVLSGTPAAADIDIAGSTTQTIDISITGLTANNGVTPQNPTCSYDAGAEGSCTIAGAAAPGAGKTLLIGIEANVAGAQAAGTSAAPTFTLNVVYS